MSLSRREWTYENIFLLGQIRYLIMLIRPGNNYFRPDQFLLKTFNTWANTGHTVWKAGDLNKVSTSNKPIWTYVSQITSCFCTKHFIEVNLHSKCEFALKNYKNWMWNDDRFTSSTKRLLVLHQLLRSVNDQALLMSGSAAYALAPQRLLSS